MRSQKDSAWLYLEEMTSHWQINIYHDDEGRSPFLNWFNEELDLEQQNLILNAFEEFVSPYGPELLTTKWMSKIMGRLFQLRIRRYGRFPEKRVLLRVYMHFYAQNQVIILSGYDKRADASPERQSFEINRALNYLNDWSA